MKLSISSICFKKMVKHQKPRIQLKERFPLKALKLRKCVVTFSLRYDKGHGLSNWQMVYSGLPHNSSKDFLTLLLKPHFLTAEMNPEITKRKKRQTSIAEKSQHMQRKWQACASPLYSSISSWVSKTGSRQAQRGFSQFRKIQVYHFKETISQTFSNNIFNG